MNNMVISIIFRTLSLIPVAFVFIPIFKSYWERKNKINGLRRTRVAILAVLFAIIFTNIYFIYENFKAIYLNLFHVSPNVFGLIIDKFINLVAFILMFYLFKHASNHKK